MLRSLWLAWGVWLACLGCGSSESRDSAASGGTGAGGSGASAGTGGAGGSAAGGSGGATTSGNIARLEAGRYHSCLTTKSGAVYCWGQGAYGALGNDGSYRGVPTKALVVDDAIDIQCGGRFTCAPRASGALFCWGEDQAGQLGGPDTKECGDAQIDSVCAPVPQAVAGIDAPLAVALGRNHSCVLLADKSVVCFGDNAEGQLGNGDLTAQMTPAPVAGLGGVEQIAAGDAHSCALVGSPGTVSCWGKNSNAAVGSGSVTDRETTPVQVAGISDAIEIAAGGEHSCARLASGSVKCWGYNYFGQLGNGSQSPTRASSAQDVEQLTDAVQLSLGRYHSCARRQGGAVACWGFNEDGALGDGSTENRSTPGDVTDISGAEFLATGSWHTCVIAAGAVMCWGDNLGGQLGIDEVNKVPNPKPVAVQQLPTD